MSLISEVPPVSRVPREQPRVPVVSMNHVPLMPTTPAHARKMLKDGVARPRRNKLGIFYIQMRIPVGSVTQPMIVTDDVGGRHEGLAVASHRQVELTAQLELPVGIPKKMADRSDLRHARRFRHCPRRPQRFNNRRHHRRYWLAPTQAAKVHARVKAVQQLCAIFPITAILVEDVRHTPRGKNDQHFTTAEVGKKLTYQEFRTLAPLTLVRGKDTAAWRDALGLTKIGGPHRPPVFASQAVDAVAIAMGVSGCAFGHPPFFVWTAIRFVRRSLHRQQFQRGGIRPIYGGTTNGAFFRKGDWVEVFQPRKRVTRRGWVTGLPTLRTPTVAVQDATGKRFGQYPPHNVRLLARASGFSWRRGTPALLPTAKAEGFRAGSIC